MLQYGIKLSVRWAGFPPKNLETEAILEMQNVDGHFKKIVGNELNLKAEVEGIEETKFQEIANNAKKNCPISQSTIYFRYQT